MPTDDEVRRRAKAREAAKEFVEFAMEEAVRASDGQQDQGAWVAYWEALRDAAAEFAPMPPPKPEPKRVVPMTDEQARLFEKYEVPYGKHEGRSVGGMMDAEPMYGDWLIGQKDEFKEQLTRYLASERGKARMEGMAF